MPSGIWDVMAKGKILIVDDEPDVVSMMQRALETDGYEALCAYDGIGALDIAESERPDLVLLDLMMPMMSGYDVCKQLKANVHTKHIPVLCVTSAHSEKVKEDARLAGAEGLLMKPFMSAELVAQVERLLGKSSAETAG